MEEMVPGSFLHENSKALEEYTSQITFFILSQHFTFFD